MDRRTSILIACALASFGCTDLVLGGTPGLSDGTSSGVTTSSSSGGPQPTTVVAMRGDQMGASQIPWLSGPPTGGIDPNALVLFIGNAPQQCPSPALATDVCVDRDEQQTVFVIPPSLAEVGHVDLANAAIGNVSTFMFATQSGAVGCNNGQMQGPGRGDLRLGARDATSLELTLTGTPVEGASTLDGHFTATFCGPAPTPATPTPTMAFPGSALPAHGAVHPDPTKLYVYLGDAKQTCHDPWMSIDCTRTSRVVVGIPETLQKKGILNLSDPALDARFEMSVDDGTMNCSRTSGAYATQGSMKGSIEIVSADATQLTLKVYGSHVDAAIGPVDADGYYKATVCQ